MKHFIQTNVRHLITGLATFLVDTGLLEQTESDNFIRTAVVVLTIVITRSALILFAKLDLKSVGLWITSKFSCVGVMWIMSAAAVGGLLPSCSSFPDLPRLPEGIVGSISYHSDKLGGDYGIECDENGCRPEIRQPFVDEDGNAVGEFEVTGSK